MSRLLCSRRFAPLAASVIVLAASTAVILPQSASARVDQARNVSSQSDVASAQSAAAAQGSRVEVTSLDDEYSTTYANSDGTLTTDTAQTPVRVQRDGKWVNVDYDLQHVDGGWSPVASPFDVVFSDGGDQDAATFGDGSKELDLSWEVTLPQPMVDGAQASYDLGHGETLHLLATSAGYEQSLVLSQPPTELPRLRLPFDTGDLTMSTDDAGGFVFSDSSGNAVYSVPAPVMYGSEVDPETDEPTQSHVVSASLVDTDAGARLDLTPSMTWLTDPSTTYPVTIDPQIDAMSGGGDVYTASDKTSPLGATKVLHVGKYGPGLTNPPGSHAFMRFSGLTSINSGATVTQATLNLVNVGANNCDPATMNVFPLTQSVTLSTVTWTTEPTVNTSSPYAPNPQPSFAHGYTGPPGASCSNSWEHINLTAMVAAWVNYPSANPNYGLRLSGTSAPQGWSFCSMNPDTSPGSSICNTSANVPTLSVTYVLAPPNTISATTLCAAPNTTDCGDSNFTSSLTPTLTASTVDPNGSNLSYSFEVWRPDNDADVEVSHGTVAGVASGATAQYVPSQLANETYYKYRVKATNPEVETGWSDWHFFTTDATFSTSVSPCAYVCAETVITDTTTPTLAVALPKMTDEVDFQFEVYSGSAQSPSGSPLVTSSLIHSQDPTVDTSYDVPSGLLSPGNTYEFRVKYLDAPSISAWSNMQVWTIDTTAPAAPTLTSATWTSGVSSGSQTATVSWSDTDSDVVEYAWQLDHTNSEPNPATSHTFTVGPGTHVLYVQALDAAGNTSDSATFNIITTGTAAALVDIDSFDAVSGVNLGPSPNTAADEPNTAESSEATFVVPASDLEDSHEPSGTNALCDDPNYSAGSYTADGDVYPDVSCPDASTSNNGAFRYNRVTLNECREHEGADDTYGLSPGGWIKNRFSWCTWVYVSAEHDVGDSSSGVSVRITFLGFTYQHSRQNRLKGYVDQFWYTGSNPSWFKTAHLTVDAGHTGGSCYQDNSPDVYRTYREWQSSPRVVLDYNSSATSGSGRDYVTHCTFQPETISSNTNTALYLGETGGRCDSAAYLPDTGCIWEDAKPVLQFKGVPEVSDHIWRAQNGIGTLYPEASSYHIPSVLTRHWPKRDRIPSKVSAICAYEFPGYASAGNDCDEYPFNSTDEGPSNPSVLAGYYSVLPVASWQNQSAGGQLSNWYRNSRILDAESFRVKP